MSVLVQRSLNAKVTVENNIIGKIEHGIVALVGFTEGDTEKEINFLVDKIINLRIFNDENGVMNKSIQDVGGSILSISQFTLYANTKKGRRPSYIEALNGESAKKLYDTWNQKLKNTGIEIQTGKFGADMKVSLINDGPVTILLEKEGGKDEK